MQPVCSRESLVWCFNAHVAQIFVFLEKEWPSAGRGKEAKIMAKHKVSDPGILSDSDKPGSWRHSIVQLVLENRRRNVFVTLVFSFLGRFYAAKLTCMFGSINIVNLASLDWVIFLFLPVYPIDIEVLQYLGGINIYWIKNVPSWENYLQTSERLTSFNGRKI